MEKQEKKLKYVKRSEALKGNTNCKGHKNHLGYTHSDETKERISASCRKRVYSEEHLHALWVGRNIASFTRSLTTKHYDLMEYKI